jgi:hypothetical protein
MRVIDAEKLDSWFTDTIRKARESANHLRRSGARELATHDDYLAQALTHIADQIADQFVQEGTIYLSPDDAVPEDYGRKLRHPHPTAQSSDMTQVYPLHSKE